MKLPQFVSILFDRVVSTGRKKEKENVSESACERKKKDKTETRT